MMKLTGKLSNGITFTEEFDGINDFLALQQSDYDVIADEILAESLIINDEKVDFTGNVGQLYDKLIKQ